MTDPPDPNLSENPSLDDVDGPGSWDDEGSGGQDRSSTIPGAGSFPGSIARARPDTFVPIISLSFGFTGILLNSRLAPEGTDLWLPTEEETLGVAEPLSRILARHVEISGEASDLADGIEAGVAATAYTVRNISAQRALQAGQDGPGWEQQQEQAREQ